MKTNSTIHSQKPKMFIKDQQAWLQRFAQKLLDQEGTDVLTVSDAIKVLKPYYPTASMMNSNELQWKVNTLLAKTIPDQVRKFVHVEGAESAPRRPSKRISYQVKDDVSEILVMQRNLTRKDRRFA
jgi:hypothetical protein